MIIAGVALTYAAWFGLYHSNSLRSALTLLNKSSGRSMTTKILSWFFLTLALYPCALAFGLERGVAAWLALITTTGVLTTFIVRTHTSFSQKLGVASLIIAPLSFVFSSSGN
jgi:hypothetical protein